MDSLNKSHFLSRLRHERLTGNQMLEALPGGTSSLSISPRPQWAGAAELNEYKNKMGMEMQKMRKIFGRRERLAFVRFHFIRI